MPLLRAWLIPRPCTDIIQHTPIGTHHMDNDLIKDIVLLCHNVNNHPNVALTILFVEDLIWFPKLVDYVTDHVHSCPLCIPKRTAFVGVGTSILAAVRLSVLYLDHYWIIKCLIMTSTLLLLHTLQY